MTRDEPGAWGKVWAQFTENLKRGWSWSGFERSCLFQNDGAGNFQDLAPVLGLDQVADGRGLAAGDIDRDGDLDLICTNRTSPPVQVLRNDFKTDRHFLFVELEPKDRQSAAGALIYVTAGGKTQMRHVALGSGYVSQHELAQHFGLGGAKSIERLQVIWQDGEESEWSDLDVDRRLGIRQGVKEIAELPLKPRNQFATGRVAAIEWDSDLTRMNMIPSGERPALGRLQLKTASGEKLSLKSPKDKPILVNLWATWCSNCRAETPELIELHNRGDVQVIGISVDEGMTLREVDAEAKRWGMNYPVAKLSPAERESVAKRLEPLTGERGLVLPLAMLLDPEGGVEVLGQGVLNVESLELHLEQRLGLTLNGHDSDGSSAKE